MSSERLAQYQALIAKAKERLGDNADDEVCERYADLVMARKSLSARMIIKPEPRDPETLLALDEAIRTIFPSKAHKVDIQITSPAVTQCPKCDHQFDPESPAETIARKLPSVIEGEAAPAQPLTSLEISRRGVELALGKRASMADAPKNYTPKPEPEPTLGYHPAVDFASKETCIKNNTVSGTIGTNEFLGAFVQPKANREFLK